MQDGIQDTNENSKPVYAEEVGELVWQKLLEWLSGGEGITPEIRDFFIERSHELRLRFQSAFLEIQRRFIGQVAAEAEFEDSLRRSIRADIPYLSGKDKLEALKILQSTTDVRMQRLESQLAGFDFFNTVQVSVQSMSDTRVSKDLKMSVKQIPSARRQQLLLMLNDMVKEIKKADEIIEVTPENTYDPLDPKYSD